MKALLMRTRLAAAAMALAIVAPAAPAFAGDATCLWDHLSSAETTAVINAGVAGDAAKVNASVSEVDAVAAAAACGLRTDNRQALSNALLGVELQRVSEIWFQRTFNVGPDQLDAAWTRLGPDIQAKLIADMQSPTTDEKLIGGVSERVAAELGVGGEKDPRATQAQVGNFIGFYLGGRTLRVINEPKL